MGLHRGAPPPHPPPHPGFLGILGPPNYGMGSTICIDREMLCLQYAGFFLPCFQTKLVWLWSPNPVSESRGCSPNPTCQVIQDQPNKYLKLADPGWKTLQFKGALRIFTVVKDPRREGHQDLHRFQGSPRDPCCKDHQDLHSLQGSSSCRPSGSSQSTRS